MINGTVSTASLPARSLATILRSYVPAKTFVVLYERDVISHTNHLAVVKFGLLLFHSGFYH